MNSSVNKKFGSILCDPKAWRMSARNLVIAAKALEPELSSFWSRLRTGGEWEDGQVAIYFMLCAFALENLMKATLVERLVAEGAISTTTQRLPDELNGHDLAELAQRCGRPDLAGKYASILQRLARSAIWYGRYPIPIRLSGMNALSSSPSGEVLSLQSYSSDDREEVMHLLREFGFVGN